MTQTIDGAAPARTRSRVQGGRVTGKRTSSAKSGPKIAAPAGDATAAGRTTKADVLVLLLRRPEGASVAQMCEAVGWLPHSVRGFMAGTLRNRHGIVVVSEKADAGRVYRAAGDGGRP